MRVILLLCQLFGTDIFIEIAGHGKLVMADGSYYEGEFEHGEIKGHGFRYNALNGNTYSGEFLDGEFHGQGVMNYRDGSVYEGDWFRNKRQGRKNDTVLRPVRSIIVI